jgi:hypothetical protein
VVKVKVPSSSRRHRAEACSDRLYTVARMAHGIGNFFVLIVPML